MKVKSRGVTLVEVLMAMVIFAGCLGAFTVFYAAMGRLAESSRNLMQAMNDARTVLEAMRNTAQSEGLTGVTTGVTGRYPAGQNLAPGFGFAALRNETVTATYANPAADPLPVTVAVDWDEAGGQNRDPIRVDTLVTRR